MLVLLAMALSVGASQPAPGLIYRLILPGSPEADRQRLATLAGDSSASDALLMAPSRLLTPRLAGRRFSLHLVSPEFHLVRNSALPHSFNEGALWAGRGMNTRMSAGVALHAGPVTLVAVPQRITEENLPFQTFTAPGAAGRARHPLANPFHLPPGSMDLPQRFGTVPRERLDPGQSSLTLTVGGLAAGVSTEQQWWGPGIRNALVLSAQAPGIPHAFLRTTRPWRTRLGTFDGVWQLGKLEESAYFLAQPRDTRYDGWRSWSAVAATWRPRFEPTLTLGVTRAVYAPWRDRGERVVPVSAAFDAFLPVGNPWSAPGDTLLTVGKRRDQLFSVFGRWVRPAAGFELWGEWARHAEPGSLGELFTQLHHSRGYTVGAQVRRLIGGSALSWRLQGELTDLEPSISYRVQPFTEWYASRSVPQGYTHQGRVIGAAIGPSGSSQWGAMDLMGRWWSVGLYGTRIRWENQAMYTYLREFRRADLSLIGGVRGTLETVLGRVAVEYASTQRANYLFQSQPQADGSERGVDLVNQTVRVTVTVGGRE
jgi:hypothetical protein